MPTVIYNVLIGGNSVGMTFIKSRAEMWARQSMYQGAKEVRAMHYREPSDISVKVSYGE